MSNDIKKLGNKIVKEIIKTDTDPREVALLLMSLAQDIVAHWNDGAENDDEVAL